VREEKLLQPQPLRSASEERSKESLYSAADVSLAINSCRRSLDASDRVEAARWLDRACRLKPGDPIARLRIVSLCLQLPDARAESLLAELIAEYPNFREPRLGLASLLLRRGKSEAAGKVLGQLLGCTSPQPDAGFHKVATAIATATGSPGWIGVSSAGMVTLANRWAWNDGRLVLRLDGEKLEVTWIAEPHSSVRNAELPAEWTQCKVLTARYEGRPLLGSPVSLTALRRVEGVVEVAPDGQLEGWAWLPGDPEAFPELRVFRESRPDAVDALIASDESVAVPAGSGAIRPRGFRLDPHGLRGNGALHVIGPDDRPLIGSPCYPADEWRSAIANTASTKRLFHGRSRRGSVAAVRSGHWQPVPVSSEQILVAREWLRNRKSVPARAPVDVIVPVYKGAGEFRNCLRSLERSLPSWARIVVVDDAAPDPVLRSAIEGAAAKRRVVLLRHENNRGFPAAVNTGMRYALAGKSTGRDVVVLNSDTIVPNGWLEALVEVAYSAPNIGSCTPFSNDASILSYPRVDAVNPALNGAETERLNSLFQRANGEAWLELPTAVGFCMFIRRDCLADVGLFRDDLFAQGYGEENDWSLRAAWLGWRHVAALGTFVTHAAGTSFGSARAELMRRNTKVLERLHPGYRAFAQEFIDRDPLAPARRNVDALRWAGGLGAAGSVVLVTHHLGGGVERHLRERISTLSAEGLRAIVIRPATPSAGNKGTGVCAVSCGLEGEFPNLRYGIPGEIDELVQLLQPDRPVRLEVHHLLGHSQLVRYLAIRLRIPYDVIIHDSALFCPRVNLCNKTRAYCGEPVAVADCTACIADAGSRLDEEIGVAELRARSHELLRAARRVVAPCEDVSERIARYFPDIAPTVQPWEPDPTEEDSARPSWFDDGKADHGIKVCVVGGISEDKGYDVILNCARDAARRRLPMSFVVVGYTMDDARLLDTGNAFVTGPFDEEELASLIASQRPQLGFVPSQCPESWCYALSSLWKSGLMVAAFSLGAQAERIRRTGRGFLMPLGLPAGKINDTLLRYWREGARAMPADGRAGVVAAGGSPVYARAGGR
jgi:GT2 family glycosyltransferase/glycosyltransferase involved in cell wall biosynthesis